MSSILFCLSHMKNLLVLHILLTFLQKSWELEHFLEHDFAHLLFLHFVIFHLFMHCLFLHSCTSLQKHLVGIDLLLSLFFYLEMDSPLQNGQADYNYNISLLKCQIFLLPLLLHLFLLVLTLCWVFHEVPNNLSFCGHIFHNDYIFL